MRRFFIAPQAIQGDQIVFEDALAHHMNHVLRLAIGEEVTACTGDGKIYIVTLEEMTKDYVKGSIKECLEHSQETTIPITLYQGMPKGDKLEWIIQKCTELGISAIVPVETSRSVVHLDHKKAEKKLERWQKIAQEASQQSKRVQIPQVGPYLQWSAFLQQLDTEKGLKILLWEEEQQQGLKAVLQQWSEVPEEIAVIVGPEGGFSTEEAVQLQQKGAICTTLGKRILRTETAGMAALSMIVYEYDEM